MHDLNIQVVLREIVQSTLDNDRDRALGYLDDLRPYPIDPISRSSVAPATQFRVFCRDSFCCRYCEKRTLFVPLLRVISDVYPDLFPFHPNWKWAECHPIYWTHGASCDHLLPMARGGKSEPNNLMTTCYMCNSMKQHWLLEEVGWEVKSPVDPTWDGLSGFYPALCGNAGIENRSYHRDWVLAMRQAATTPSSQEGLGDPFSSG